MSNIKLKPCPLCQAETTINYYPATGQLPEYYEIECTEGCFSMGDYNYKFIRKFYNKMADIRVNRKTAKVKK